MSTIQIIIILMWSLIIMFIIKEILIPMYKIKNINPIDLLQDLLISEGFDQSKLVRHKKILYILIGKKSILRVHQPHKKAISIEAGAQGTISFEEKKELFALRNTIQKESGQSLMKDLAVIAVEVIKFNTKYKNIPRHITKDML